MAQPAVNTYCVQAFLFDVNKETALVLATKIEKILHEVQDAGSVGGSSVLTYHVKDFKNRDPD